MLALLPLSVFALLLLYSLGRQSISGVDTAGPRRAFLKGYLLWGASVVAISEVLSQVHAINRLWLSLAWASLAAGLLIAGLRNRSIQDGVRRLTAMHLRLSPGERVVLTGMLVVIGGVFLTAWFAPPNNTDSLQYHMSRIAHWAQSGSLEHYATAYHPQLWSPIWAESAVLNLRVLWGSDQLANLIQWFSMLVSLVGVSSIARELGAKRSGQLLAGAFAISIPMGILQASSTQTDYAAASWLVCLAYFTVRTVSGNVARSEWAWIGLALGLGTLTKGTYYLYALPFILWWLVVSFLRRGASRSSLQGLGIVLIVTLLNAGFWSRNLSTYGGPLGPSDWLDTWANLPRSPGQALAAILDQIGMQFATPSEEINRQLVSGIRAFSEGLGAGSGSFDLVWSWNHEDLAGSPLHLVLIPASLVGVIYGTQNRRGLVLGYAAAGLGAYLLFSSVVKFAPYGVRLQLPFLVVWAPIAGLAGAALNHRRSAIALAGLLVVASLPWVVLNRSRPLIGAYPRTMTESILNEPASAVLLANWPSLRDPYVAVASDLRESGCAEVGLQIDSHDLEYAFWWLLRAPQSGIRIEVVSPLQSLAHLADRSFKPCAVICTICEDRAELFGFHLVADYGPVRLYTDR